MRNAERAAICVATFEPSALARLLDSRPHDARGHRFHFGALCIALLGASRWSVARDLVGYMVFSVDVFVRRDRVVGFRSRRSNFLATRAIAWARCALSCASTFSPLVLCRA